MNRNLCASPPPHFTFLSHSSSWLVAPPSDLSVNGTTIQIMAEESSLNPLSLASHTPIPILVSTFKSIHISPFLDYHLANLGQATLLLIWTPEWPCNWFLGLCSQFSSIYSPHSSRMGLKSKSDHGNLLFTILEASLCLQGKNSISYISWLLCD